LLDSQGLPELRDGLVRRARPQGNAQEVVGFGVILVDPNGRPELGNGVSLQTLDRQGSAKGEVGFKVILLDSDCLLELSNGLVKQTPLPLRQTPGLLQ